MCCLQYLGSFDLEEAAAMAYDYAAMRRRGSRAITNFDPNIYIHSSTGGSVRSPPCLQFQFMHRSMIRQTILPYCTIWNFTVLYATKNHPVCINGVRRGPHSPYSAASTKQSCRRNRYLLECLIFFLQSLPALHPSICARRCFIAL